jgi:hypothetical protein
MTMSIELELIGGGQPCEFNFPAQRIVCCDCCLAHIVLLEHDNETNRDFLTLYRDENNTRQARETLSVEELEDIIKELRVYLKRKKRITKVVKKFNETKIARRNK